MLITNFAAGELSPTLNGRVDIQQYYQGASVLENFEIIPTGGIQRRTGMKRLLDLNGESRIIPFIVDANHVYILVLQALTMKVYKTVYDNGKVNVTFVTSKVLKYQNMAVINQIQYTQTYNSMILVHKEYEPVLITYKNNSFDVAYMSFNFYPDVVLTDPDNQVIRVKENAPTVTKTAEGALQCNYIDPNNDPQVKVYAYGNDAYYLHNGRLYKYPFTGSAWESYSTDDAIDTSLFSTPGNYPGSVAYFQNRLFFASTNNAQQKVWASMTPDTSLNRINKFSTYKKYITFNSVIKDADLHTFTCDLAVEDITATGTVLRNVSQDFSTIENITDYYITHELIPIGTKVKSYDAAAHTLTIDTSDISITEDQQNMVCNMSLWRKADQVTSDDYEYQVLDQNVTTADCGFYFELASDQNDAIKFISSGKFMAIATESTIWSLAPGCNALSLQVEMQGRYGSDEIQGQAIATATIYFAQGKKGIREFYYDSAAEAFQTNNIAIHAQHLLTESPVKDFDYTTNPYNRLILTKENGKVAALLYDKTNGVMAWNRITRTAGTIESVAVTRGYDESDLIFFVIKDGVNYFLEMMNPAEEVYLDSWEEYDSTKTYPAEYVKSDDEVYIGYKLRSYIKSMPVIANDPNGKKRITNLIVRYLDSYMPVLKITGLADEHFNNIQQLPYSGVAQITYPGTTDRDVYFELEAEHSNPVTILAVNAALA